MKKWILVLGTAMTLAACSNNGGQTGVQDDGIRGNDPNGAREGTTRAPGDSSATGGGPTYTEKRDSSGTNMGKQQ